MGLNVLIAGRIGRDGDYFEPRCFLLVARQFADARFAKHSVERPDEQDERSSLVGTDDLVETVGGERGYCWPCLGRTREQAEQRQGHNNRAAHHGFFSVDSGKMRNPSACVRHARAIPLPVLSNAG